jgi:AraC-like DNA-binding protein
LGIAFDSGFNSKTAFNTFFKKTVGVTPSEFRKNQSEGNFTEEEKLN